MKIKYIRDLVSLITADKGVAFTYVPEDFDDLLHYDQLKLFRKKIGLPEEYSPGMPLPREVFEINNKLTADMRKFKVSAGRNNNPLKPVEKGLYELPNDFYYPTAITWFLNSNGSQIERPFRIMSDLEFQECSASVVTKPSIYFPICKIVGDNIAVEPSKDIPIHLSYLRLPKRPVTVVIDNDGFYEIDTDNSIDLEWDDINIIELITLILGDMGITLNSQNVAQYSENLKNKGV